MPVFMPSPPAMECTCAASPARKTRPTRNRSAMRTLTRKVENQVGSVSFTPARRACRSNIRWKDSSDGGRLRPWASCSGAAWSCQWSLSRNGQSMIPPSSSNHWCQ